MSRPNNIHDMDEAVGGVVEELRRTGHYGNTIIMFISDNGPRKKIGNTERSANYPLRKKRAFSDQHETDSTAQKTFQLFSIFLDTANLF